MLFDPEDGTCYGHQSRDSEFFYSISNVVRAFAKSNPLLLPSLTLLARQGSKKAWIQFTASLLKGYSRLDLEHAIRRACEYIIISRSTNILIKQSMSCIIDIEIVNENTYKSSNLIGMIVDLDRAKQETPLGSIAEDLSGLQAPRGIRPFETKAHFAGSRAALAAARELFQEELRSLPDACVPADQIEEVVAVCGELSESFHSILRMNGTLASVTSDESAMSLALRPMVDASSLDGEEALRSVEVVPISELQASEAASVLGRMTGNKTSSLFSKDERSENGRKGGRSSAESLSPQARSERAKKASQAGADQMTPEERSERARKAVQARWDRYRAAISDEAPPKIND